MADDQWLRTTLGEIAASGYGLVDGPFGSSLPASAYTDDGIPVIRGSNLSLGTTRFDDSEFVFVSKETARRLARSICRAGDIVFTKKGTLGQTGIVPENHRYREFLLSSNQMKLSVDPRIADPLFVYYCVSSRTSREKIVRDSEMTGVPKTNVTYLRSFPISLPPLPEQHAIAHILGTLDDKIELNHRTNETLEAIARAMFKSWFVDFDPVRAKADGEAPESICQRLGLTPELLALFPDRFQDLELDEIPHGWEISEVGDVVKVVGGSTPSTKNPEYWDDGIIHWATPKDFSTLSSRVLLDTERKITDLGLRQISSGLLPPGTVLMSSRAPIGYLALSTIPISVNQGFIAMVCDGPISSYYMLHWCEHNLDRIKQRAGGTTFAEISKSAFRPIQLVVPEKALMDQFDTIVGPIFAMVAERGRESITLANVRDSLLPKLISGELPVPSLEDETL